MDALLRIQALITTETRVLARDASTFGILLGMPLVLMTLIRGTFAVPVEGGGAALGGDLAVPGFATMFSFFLTVWIVYAFVREHGWGTWPRLDASGAATWEILVGKLAPFVAAGLVQFALLFSVGGWIAGIDVQGSTWALAAVCGATVAVVVSLGMVLVAFCRSHLQANMLANLVGILLAALGGALAPLSALPAWAQAAAPATPHYWSMLAFRRVIVEGGGLADVGPPLAVLLAAAAALLAVALLRFRRDERKHFAHA